VSYLSGVPGNFFWGGGVQQIQLRTEGRENSDLGVVATSQGFCSICKWVKPVFLLGCYRCIFHRTWNSAQLCQNFRIFFGGWSAKFCGETPLGERNCRLESNVKVALNCISFQGYT
jgi:hypothetical protein